jgi:hypothetical protein
MNTRLSIPPDDRDYPSAPDGSHPRLYGLLAVEVEPGRIAYYHLELDHCPAACVIEMERDTADIHAWDSAKPLRSLDLGPTRIRATISGTVVSDRPNYRPPARTDAHIGPPTALTTGPGRD